MDPIKRGVSSRDFGELNTKLNICTQKIFWKIAKMKNKTNYVNSLPILWQGLSKKVSVSFVKREWGREGGWGVCAATCSKSLPVAVFPISDVRPSRTIVQKRTWSYLWRRVEKKKNQPHSYSHQICLTSSLKNILGGCNREHVANRTRYWQTNHSVDIFIATLMMMYCYK